MMLTVAPVHEKTSVTASQNVVRDDSRLLLTLSSEMPRSFSGPSVSSQPVATTASHHTTSGANARTTRSRPASLAVGRDVSSCQRVRNAISLNLSSCCSVGVGGLQPM